MNIYKLGNIAYKVLCVLICIAFLLFGLGALKNHIYILGVSVLLLSFFIPFKFYKEPSRKNFWYIVLIVFSALYFIGKATNMGYLI